MLHDVMSIEWSGVLLQYVGFAASFLIIGAVGFRYGLLRDAVAATRLASAAAAAALVGLVGVAFGFVSFFEGLLHRAAAKHQSFADAFHAGGSTTIVQLVCLVALVLAFVLAWRRSSLGWPLAAVAAIVFALRNVLAGRLSGMVNPLHVLGGSLWIGTLFVMVFCGLRHLLRPGVSVEDREQAVAKMVRRFSVVGLGGAGLLGVTGVITAWTHLPSLDALWTTSYGCALLAKLGVVAIVLGLGAWNWRRVGPALGSDGGALEIRRSASIELAFAAVVLVITGILVSLPSPK